MNQNFDHMMDDYHPHYDNYGWPDGRVLPNKRGKSGSRRNLVRLLILQHNTCFYCNKTIDTLNSNVDHVMPLWRGGSRGFTNLVACHIICNSEKGGRLPTEEEIHRLAALHINHKGPSDV